MGRGTVGWSSVGAEMSKVGWWLVVMVVVVVVDLVVVCCLLLPLLLQLPVRCFPSRQVWIDYGCVCQVDSSCIRKMRGKRHSDKKTFPSRGLSAQPSVVPATHTKSKSTLELCGECMHRTVYK
jgi:hypothetical protein